MSAESSRARELQDRLAQLSGSEYKIVAYLYGLLDKFDHAVWLTDKTLSKATGVSLRQIATVRKSLAKLGLVGSETVCGRGTAYTAYRSPAALAAGPESPSPSVGFEEPILERRDAGEMETKEGVLEQWNEKSG